MNSHTCKCKFNGCNSFCRTRERINSKTTEKAPIIAKIVEYEPKAGIKTVIKTMTNEAPAFTPNICGEANGF